MAANISTTARWPRRRIYTLNRLLTLALATIALGSLWWQPATPIAYAADTLLRAYLFFLCAVMAHEASHGHLGATRAANTWWGHLAMLPLAVPSRLFRETHPHHHAHTNVPAKDPDLFLKPRRAWEIPFRSLALTTYWLYWLWREGRMTRRAWLELGLVTSAHGLLFGVLAACLGPERVLLGLLPAKILMTLVLWHDFGLNTHEGHATGPAATRSHDYEGRAIFWLTLGLALHRVHHMRPGLAWVEMAPHVKARHGAWLKRLRPTRSIVVSTR